MLRSMRCRQLAKYFAARTNSDRSDCRQARGLGCVAHDTRLRCTRTLAQTACMRVRCRFARYARQRRGRFGTRLCEGWSFLLKTVRQTDRQKNLECRQQRDLGIPRECSHENKKRERVTWYLFGRISSDRHGIKLNIKQSLKLCPQL